MVVYYLQLSGLGNQMFQYEFADKYNSDYENLRFMY